MVMVAPYFMQTYCLNADVYLLGSFCFVWFFIFLIKYQKQYTELPLMGFQIERNTMYHFWCSQIFTFQSSLLSPNPDLHHQCACFYKSCKSMLILLRRISIPVTYALCLFYFSRLVVKNLRTTKSTPHCRICCQCDQNHLWLLWRLF